MNLNKIFEIIYALKNKKILLNKNKSAVNLFVYLNNYFFFIVIACSS